MKKLILVSVLWGVMLVSFAMAEPGDTLWTRIYGGYLSEHGYSVRQTLDGGYILTGLTSTFGPPSGNVWLMKTDANGDSLWTRIFGGNGEDIGWALQQTADSGYIVAGHTSSFGAGNSDIYLIKTDANGDTLIGHNMGTATYGGSDWEKSYSVEQTPDGGYIVAGRTKSFGAGGYDYYVVKTDDLGDVIWERTYGGSANDRGFSVTQTGDGGYLVAGESYSFGAGNADVYLLKIDANGDTIWTRTYGGSSSEKAMVVQITSDGGYALFGHTFSFGAGSADFYLVKTDANGDTLWTRTYGGTDAELLYEGQQTADDGYVMVGYTQSFGAGDKDVYVVKTDANGDTVWTHAYGGWSYEFGNSIHQTDDGSYIVLGYTGSYGNGSQFYLLKIAGQAPEPVVSIDMIPDNPPVVVPAGGSFTYTGILANNTDEIQVVDVGLFLDVPGIGFYGPLLYYLGVPLSPYQTISIPGITQSVPGFAPLGTYDYVAYCGDYPVKIDSASFEFTVIAPIAGGANEWSHSGWFDDKVEVIASEFILAGNYPNPFNATTTISYQLPADSEVSLEIFNLLGQKIEILVNCHLEAGHHAAQWDAFNYSSGIYFYKLTAGDKVFTKRMTLLK